MGYSNAASLTRNSSDAQIERSTAGNKIGGGVRG